MSEPVDVNVGDIVIVVEQRQPTHEATVTEVGRVWVTVDMGGWERRFRLDDQTTGSNVGLPPRFYTLAQWNERSVAADAATFLREQGIDLRYDSPWRGREVELANILRNV